ncbi:MAG TPA: acetyl-CoA C-acetyltransferase [Burkholderiaceae bacterium]|nr:acetyl-CoA C-acetyltransferase [Burkholderiaceae bacterium]
MAEAYIVDALRTPTGKRGGALAPVHAADLGAFVLKTLMERNAVPPGDVDDVIFGCVDAVGPNAGVISRTSWLAAGLPDHVPGTVIDRACGSSQQAVHFADQAVMSGTQDVVVAGGVQNMSQVPIAYAMVAAQPLGFTDPFSGSKGWKERFGDKPVNQFYAAQIIADKWGCSRDDMEAFAAESHTRALRAQAEGRFAREIVALNGLSHDETARAPNREKMATLQPVDAKYPSITAAVSSSTCDAAAALLIVSEAALKRYGLKPRARIHHLSVLAADPIWHLTAPIPATAAALKKAGMKIDDIDLVEINEAFASVVMAWLKETGYAHARTNVNGGALALGHPLGASGARLMTTLLHELERTGGRYGLQTMCEGGGQANVTIIERL